MFSLSLFDSVSLRLPSTFCYIYSTDADNDFRSSNFVCFFPLHFQCSFHVCFFSSHFKTMLCFYIVDFFVRVCVFFFYFFLVTALKLTVTLLWSAFYVNIQCLQRLCWTFFCCYFVSANVVAVHRFLLLLLLPFCCWSSACYSNTFLYVLVASSIFFFASLTRNIVFIHCVCVLYSIVCFFLSLHRQSLDCTFYLYVIA